MHNFKDLVLSASFSVPSFQRAYSWESDQVEKFISDLEEASKGSDAVAYYYGHFLLLKRKADSLEIEMIDGQQRITTAMLFFAMIRHRGLLTEQMNSLLKDRDNYRLKTVIYDNEFLKLLFNGENDTKKWETTSQERLSKTYNLLKKLCVDKEENELQRLVDKLLGSYITADSLNDVATANYHFVLQNNRGKKLSRLEQLKAFISYQYYLLGVKESDDSYITFVKNFEQINRNIEQISLASEDTVLKHCLHAHYYGFNLYTEKHATGDVDNFDHHFLQEEGTEQRIAWLNSLVLHLGKAYEAIKELSFFKNKNLTDDASANLNGILVLKERKIFYIFFIKLNSIETFNSNSISATYQEFFKFFENFLFRTTFSTKSKKTVLTHSFDRSHLTEILNSSHQKWYAELSRYTHPDDNWWAMDNATLTARLCRDKAIYGVLTHAQISYILWRYDLSLSSGVIKQTVSWDTFKDHSTSIEHICPQSVDPHSEQWNEWREKGYAIVAHNEEKDWDEFVEEFYGYMHCWGNLALVTASLNSQLSNKPFMDKVEIYNKNSAIKQLLAISSYTKNSKWTATALKRRHQDVVSFIKQQWLS